MVPTEFECYSDEIVTGTVSPGSNTENDSTLHQNLFHYGDAPLPMPGLWLGPGPGGPMVGAESLGLSGPETNASVPEWGVHSYQGTPNSSSVPTGTPHSWSTPTSSPGQEPFDFSLISSPEAFENYFGGRWDQGYDSNGSSLLPSPLAQYIPSPPPPPPLLTPAPAPVTKKQKKRARPKRVAESMREWRKRVKPEVCELCPKRFAYVRGLDRHWRTHDRKLGFATPGFKCPQCEVTIGYKFNLKRHVETQHSGGGPSP